ncbi:MAG TPA: outer membrane protein assembly factor BamC [Casimicrobiaceae bacterium]|nr:outer membrane protein assembly factor BamC [Casimicrobiaceae bacterium]
MVETKFRALARALAIMAMLLAVAGCETNQFSKKIDYKSAQSAPTLELPPDLSAPQYDDRFTVTTASGLAAQGGRPKTEELIAPDATSDARIARAGTQRWLVVKTTPEIAWNTTKQFWTTTGFVLAVDQPTVGIMETDWAENRADVPNNWLSSTLGKYIDVFGETYRRDKFRTRIERGTEPGTVDIYISHRGSEQVPTATVDRISPAGWTWAVMPPDPGLEAEMLSRLMQRFGTTQAQAQAAVQGSMAPNAPERARLEKMPNGTSQLIVDDNFDRAWRRVGLALDRVGFTVVDRDRSKGTYFVRYSNPDSDGSKGKKGFLDSLMFWKDKDEKPEQYRITVAQADPNSLVTVQDPDGAPDKSQNGEKILALLKDQLK